MISRRFLSLSLIALLAGCGPHPSNETGVPTILVHPGPSADSNMASTIQSALEAIGENPGGGIVRLTKGTYLSGPLNLHTNTTLQLDTGAILKASDDPDLYPSTPAEWDGDGKIAHRAFLLADHADNVAITGSGTIDGNGKRWWDVVRATKKKSTDIVAPSLLSRPRLLEFAHCGNIRVEGIHVMNSPGWQIHPLYSDHVVIANVHVSAPLDSPNTDGIDPNSCTNVLIDGCTIDVGDDCIAIKSGVDAAGRRINAPSENITVQNCTMLHGHGGVTLGSEMSGGIRHITIKDCTFNGTSMGVRLKTRRGRGSDISDITYENITMTNCKYAIHMTMFYFGKNDGSLQPVDDTTPAMKNVTIRNVTATDCENLGFLEGLPERALANITLDHVVLSGKKGIVARDVTGLLFKDVDLKVESGPVFSTVGRVEGTGLPQ